MKELMKNDCAALDAYFTEPWENCEGHEFTFKSLTWAKKKFDRITYTMMSEITVQ